MPKSATCVGSTCAGSYIKNSKFTTSAAPTATTEGLLAACVVGLPVRLTCMQQVDALDELLTRNSPTKAILARVRVRRQYLVKGTLGMVCT